MDNKTDKTKNKLLESAVKSFFAAGLMTEEDIKSKESALDAVLKVMNNGSEEKIDEIRIDHRDTLIEYAETFYKTKQYYLTKVFYATYFEHSINSLIDLYCNRNMIDNQTKKEIIRSLSIKSKFTWLLTLLKFPTIKEKHLKVILNVADDRNAFIHYKWIGMPDAQLNSEEVNKKEQDTINELNKIKKTVTYLKTYENKIRLLGKKGAIEKLFK